MRRFVITITCVLCTFLGVNAQQSEANTGELQFEVSPSLFVLTSGSIFDFGPKVELSLRKDGFNFGLTGEILTQLRF